MKKRTIGMWLYQNGGGDLVQKKLIKKLKEREIEVVSGLNLRNGVVRNKNIYCKSEIDAKVVKMNNLKLFFSYNASEQTQYQMYLYKALSCIMPTINNYDSFELTEDKFYTAFLLQNHGVRTANFKLCHRDEGRILTKTLKKWGKMVYKPTDGWGGVGLTKIESEASLDMLLPFLNQMDLRFFYVEQFINYDNTDYRVDIVDGKFVGCYGRRASSRDWRTNISSGGSVFLREPEAAVIELALKAVKVTGLEIAGVDIIYDRSKEEYVVLEVNGIPAFATPEQESKGLDFNEKKIDLIAGLIDKKTRNQECA